MGIKETREIILSTAAKLFSRYGFYKTSMDEISKMSRRAKGSLYYHFPSKELLFKEVVASEIENLKSQLAPVVNDFSLYANEKLKKYLTLRMEILNESENYKETLKADFFEHFDFIDDLRKDLDNWEKVQMRNIILQGVKENIFADMGDKLEVMLDVFVMVQKSLETPFLLQGKFEDFHPYFDDLLSILIKGLGK